MSSDEAVHALPPDSEGVATIEMSAGEENYLTVFILRALAAQLAAFGEDPDCGAIVVRATGKHFTAGRDWGIARDPEDTADAIYEIAPSLVNVSKPWIAELTGGSIGVGMGLALCADYRVAAETAYLWPKFVRIGIHHGFGMSATLPYLVGAQRATEQLSTGRRVSMDEAYRVGLVDRVVPLGQESAAAHDFAAELSRQPRAALAAIRATMRGELESDFISAIAREQEAQKRLYETRDFQEATDGGYRYANK